MTPLLLSFAATLLVAVLVSGLAHRTVLSTAVLFLLAGFLLGEGVLGFVLLRSGDEQVSLLAELALFAVLFSDGMRVSIGQLRRGWRLPARALGIGLPLTLLVTAVIAKYVVGLGWVESLLIGAVLAPTDPVFAAAIVGREEVPHRVRHVLNVESGVNDGLALPVVLVLIAVAGGADSDVLVLAEEIALGIVVGIAVPYLAIRLERLRMFSAAVAYEPLNAFAIGLLVLAISLATHANLFLAAFSAGVTIATSGPSQRRSFEHFGENIAELLKLLALLVFGALITPKFLFQEISLSGYVFAVLALVLARPLALWPALLGTALNRRERLATMWFGPKGFASVVYGLIVLESGITEADRIFHLVALVIILSILAHSSTDVLVARRFDDAAESGEQAGPARR